MKPEQKGLADDAARKGAAKDGPAASLALRFGASDRRAATPQDMVGFNTSPRTVGHT